MKTVYVNEIWTADKEVVRGFIVVEKTIIEALKTLYSDRVQSNLQYLMFNKPTSDEGFHMFSRFCQFVVHIRYDATPVILLSKVVKMGISIELMYFGTSDNVNDTFDYMLELRKSGWGEGDRDTILEIAYQIKKTIQREDADIAELVIKDPYNALSSYL